MRAVPDPRCGKGKRHDQAEVLVCLVYGFLAGKTTIRRSLNWCRCHLEELREFLPLKNGIASPSTACRILWGIDEELFLLAFMEWIGEIADTKGIHLSIDGKALRAAAEKEKGTRAPMVLNAIDAVTGLVLAQLPIRDKDHEITKIPELLRLLDIRRSTVTMDAVGTQTKIMEQILSQGGHFVLMVKGNQPQSYEEIVRYLGEMAQDRERMRREEGYKPRYPEMQERYEEARHWERNRDRMEYRFCGVCRDSSLLTRTQKEWPFIGTVGLNRQMRIPVKRDMQGDDITPDIGTFLKGGSGRSPGPVWDGEMGKDIQETGMVSDMVLTAEEMGRIKREHWAIENRLHHVLDETFREDRSPAKKSKNNLALIRKFAYNILRMSMLRGECAEVMTEAMDEFSAYPTLRKRYIFSGIASFY